MSRKKKEKRIRNRLSDSGRISRGGLLSLFLACALCVDCFQLGNVALIKGDTYRSRAELTQLMDRSLSAPRGTIYDRNRNVLAQSATVWKIFLDPQNVQGDTEEEKQEVREEIASNLAVILGLDSGEILSKLCNDGSRYQVIKTDATLEQMQNVEAFRQEKYRPSSERRGYLMAIGIESATKRFYPGSTLASTLLGFTRNDGNGSSGLEAYYNNTLAGIDGRIITAQDGKQQQLKDEYAVTYDPQPGTSLVLTIDETVQYTLENALRQTVTETQAAYAYGIVSDVNTGAILGMVTMPDFDPNNAYEVTDEEVERAYREMEEDVEKSTDEQKKADWAAKSEESKRALARTNAQYARWRNRAISDTYEPGSVSKCITVSAALEEGLVSETTPYNCTGAIIVGDREYNCWKAGGHGSETLPDLLKNSCNPFAITIAKLLGTDKYYKYFEAFGFTEPTGIDLSGEFSPTAGVTYHTPSRFGIAQLASYSFGQSFQVSPIQMISAIGAIANGGRLMTPYVVAQKLDGDGNVIETTEPTVRRQVISETTAKRVAAMMEDVVATGTGKNAYVAGYHVAGKTGTSEKLLKKGEYIASFVGFAPADDPQIAILIVVDEPQGDHGGGAIAAPVAGEVLYSILPYLNIEASYSEEELKDVVTRCPNAVNSTVEAARSRLVEDGYTVRVRGDGDVVLAQIPDAGNQIPRNGVIILYTEQVDETENAIVPDFSGLSVSDAYDLAADANLNIKISGVSNDSSGVRAYKQSLEYGQEVAVGTVLTVYFRTKEGVDDWSD